MASSAAPSAGASTVLQPAPSSETVPAILPSHPDLGYARGLEQRYRWGREVGKGGNATVRVVVDRTTGVEYACKSVSKVLPDSGASDKKKAGHLDGIKREVLALTVLKGSLNAVMLEDVYEDDDTVHIVMELCNGGELWHRICDRHYSERTVRAGGGSMAHGSELGPGCMQLNAGGGGP